MMVYYNENDKFSAAWLRELIAAGHIAFGVVDERSIEDVLPSEVMQFKQCHWFAGVGVWSYALRSAGIPDDYPIWTGSCPCQPFSAAGKGDGFADERHLWPTFYHLITQCKPKRVIGEQVASKAVDDWIDLVHADLEAVGYAFGSVPFPSAGVGAPHIRDRNFWVAESSSDRCTGSGESRTIEARSAAGRNFEGSGTDERGELSAGLEGSGVECSRMGNNNDPRLEGFGRGHQAESGRVGAIGSVAEAGESSGLGDTSDGGRQQWLVQSGGDGTGVVTGGREQVESGEASRNTDAAPATGPTNGFWRDADWLFCRDGKWRPVMSGTFPLAHGAPARVGRLRGYGNAINAQQAQAFIEACGLI